MDFSVIFQLRTKKFWWMDVIFYFVMSLLVATILCYVIFLVKNNIQRKDIQAEIVKLQGVGTELQKQQEKDVLGYQKKINDFSGLLKNHEFASNVLAFMENQTRPNVWFKQFNLDEKNASVQLSGETDDLDAFSRQVAVLEKDKYVKNLGTLNTSLSDSAKDTFAFSVTLDPSIFSYTVNNASILDTTSPANSILATNSSSTQPLVQQGQPAVTPNTTPVVAGGGTPTNAQPANTSKSGEKLITYFHFLLSPEVIGTIDQTKFEVTLNVPYGTDVRNLKPTIYISPGATILPASGVGQDFETPVAYTVTAQDSTIQKYTVKVVVTAPPEVAVKSNQSGSIIIIIVISVVLLIAIVVAIFLFIRRKNKGQKPKI